MYMKSGVFFLIAIAFFLFPLVSGSILVKNTTIEKIYNPGEAISGEVTLKINSEFPGIILRSNFENNITLKNWIEKSLKEEGIDYNCSVSGCAAGYNSVGNVVSAQLNGKKTFGFSISGKDINEILSVKTTVKSNALESCFLQNEINVISESSYKIINNNYVNTSCYSNKYGCFDKTLNSYQEVEIGSNPLCEKMELQVAPAFVLGAKIKNSTSGVGEIKMQLYDSEGNFLKDCILPKHNSSLQELECVLPFASPRRQEYFICVKSDGGNYRINSETSGRVCGSDDISDVENLNSDFELYSRPLKFGQVNTKLDDAYFESIYGERLSEIFENYLFQKYPSGNCQPECIIPFDLMGESQNIQFLSSEIRYKRGQSTVIDQQVYNVEVEEPQINTEEINLLLDEANFSIPFGTKEKKFILYANNEKIYETEINVSDSFSFDIQPQFVYIGRDTLFQVITNETINSSIWNFDGSNILGDKKQAIYRYDSPGTYDLEVNLLNSKGISARKNFEIVVGNPKEASNITIKEYESRLKNLSLDLNKIDGWIKNKIENKINLTDLNQELTRIKQEFNLASTEEEYLDIIQSLIDLEIPYDIGVSEESTLPMTAGLLSADFEYIQEISNKEGYDSEALSESISSWINTNFDVEVTAKLYSATYKSGSEDLYTAFTYKIKPKNEHRGNIYIIVNYPVEQLIVNGGNDFRGVSGGSGAYKIINLAEQKIEIMVSEKISIEDFGAYISPEISQLSLTLDEPIGQQEEPKFKTKGFLIWISLLLICFFVVYIIMQEWYKRHYEDHLFKNRDQLYNLINFIYNGRKAGLSNNDIKKKLGAVGWNSEQINYAFRKIDGKRTGMFEIPIFKFLENKKVKEEINKRQPNKMVDVRFIKERR